MRFSTSFSALPNTNWGDTMKSDRLSCGCSRRDFLRRGLYGVGVTAGLPAMLSRTAHALAVENLDGAGEANPDRILVVIELSGGNDGLNTVIPFLNDEYYKVRPTLAIPREAAIEITGERGLHPSRDTHRRS